MNLVFLFGSGITQPPEKFSTTALTTQILCGKGVKRYSDGTYYLDKGSQILDKGVENLITLLKRLKIEIELYYKGMSVTNYENLYYVANQILDSNLGNFDNPIVKSFTDKIAQDVYLLIAEHIYTSDGGSEFNDLLSETVNYIHDSVWHMLQEKSDQPDYLKFLCDAIYDSNFSESIKDIYTLNHDLLLENYFNNSGANKSIEIIDGFDKPINEIRYWNPILYDSNLSNIRFFKLHGSIQWFLFEPDGGGPHERRIGAYLGNDLYHTKSSDNKLQLPIEGRPILLIGTHNKMFEYIHGIFLILHSNFHKSLNNSRNLIVSGYSFGDKGVNTLMAEWMHDSVKNRLIVIHPDSKNLRAKARGAISNRWGDWETSGKLVTINRSITEKIEWSEIKKYLITD